MTDGKYVGMLVRGAGETFNLIVPVRRMQSWVEARGAGWVLDPKSKMPTLEEIKKIDVENDSGSSEKESEDAKSFPYLIRITKSVNKSEKIEEKK